MTRKISQREARALKKRVVELERAENDRRYAWAQEWPNGTKIATETLDSVTGSACRIARKLKHAVVVVTKDNTNTVEFFALPLGSRS